ncbi:MAG: DUF2235 domain-containing protein [Leptolyngbya sp. SIO1E4]|nr:DUF2235 domain-containing protein [Leptolyngbya sp. SIO1E4]
MALYAFDGTGDRWDAQSPITATTKTKNGRYLTNVVFFYAEYLKAGMQAEYFPGVGSSVSITDRIVGGAFGAGASGVINAAFRKLKDHFKSGDQTIDIIGYSRGAALARAFADKTFKDYSELVDKTGKPLNGPPDIRFIGLFDTVASFGMPLNDTELFFQERIPISAQNTFHAMALDVRRAGFGLDRAYGENVLEVWFRGGHGDIGGNSELSNGLPNRNRTNLALVFMLQKARAVGINLKETFDYPIDIHAPVVIDENNLDDDPSRQHRNHDVFHYSFFDEAKQVIEFPGCVPLPERSQLVIEEVSNEPQLSEPRLLQLTPELSAKYPDTQSIYNKLYGLPQ